MTVVEKRAEKYTYSDYLTWLDDERWEIIDGEAYNMTPAPGIKHQNVVGTTFSLLKQKLKGKPCRPFVAPTDVVLSDHDVVQPDIIVVCDEKKITEASIQGAPDLVVEVLSPATALKDKREKKALYERSAVREYIIIDPFELYVERFVLKGKRYGESEIFGPQEVLPLNSLTGIDITLWEVFEVAALDTSDRKRQPGEEK
ncbi:MAG: Uma2 family endonuclease [Candidatus Polarisedimenticolaceae bacterium]|nr:Uma2 family endonuclease [Candidatus Polarisedimenticolaceae bacterium]